MVLNLTRKSVDKNPPQINIIFISRTKKRREHMLIISNAL